MGAPSKRFYKLFKDPYSSSFMHYALMPVASTIDPLILYSGVPNFDAV
jgi:hypothetical protein